MVEKRYRHEASTNHLQPLGVNTQRRVGNRAKIILTIRERENVNRFGQGRGAGKLMQKSCDWYNTRTCIISLRG